MIYEICFLFVKVVNNEYKRLSEHIKYWFDHKINGKDSQIAKLEKYVLEYISHKIRRKGFDSDMVSYQVDKETTRLINKIEQYKKKYQDDDYAQYSALVDELPEKNVLKIIRESDFDYLFTKTVEGRKQRRAWIFKNVDRLNFVSINRIKNIFNYYANLLNYNINTTKYKEFINRLSEYDIENFMKIKRILETKVQTSEYEALIANFLEEIELQLIDAF